MCTGVIHTRVDRCTGECLWRPESRCLKSSSTIIQSSHYDGIYNPVCGGHSLSLPSDATVTDVPVPLEFTEVSGHPNSSSHAGTASILTTFIVPIHFLNKDQLIKELTVIITKMGGPNKKNIKFFVLYALFNKGEKH